MRYKVLIVVLICLGVVFLTSACQNNCGCCPQPVVNCCSCRCSSRRWSDWSDSREHDGRPGYPSRPEPPGPPGLPGPPSPPSAPSPSPSSSSPSAPSVSTSKNKVSNTFDSDITVPIDITNTINIENKIHIPVTVNSTNINNVNIKPAPSAPYPPIQILPSYPTPTPYPTPLPSPTPPSYPISPPYPSSPPYPTPPTISSPPPYTTPQTPTQPTQPTRPTPTPVTVSPKPIVPTWYPPWWKPAPIIIVSEPIQQSAVGPGCCLITQPCLQPQCPQVNHCGNECISPYIYRPQNPCTFKECERRDYIYKRVCSSSQFDCSWQQQSCGGCGNDWYQSYNGFQQCQGCFQKYRRK